METALNAELDRREFLSYCGATLLGVLGISGLIKTLTHFPPDSESATSGGYGSSTYGGKS